MLKRTFLYIFRVTGLIIFAIFLLTSGFIKYYLFDSIAIYYLILIVSPLLLLPFVKRWTKSNIIKQFIIVLIFVVILQASSTSLNYFRGYQRFSYQLGNTSELLGVIIRNKPMQKLLFKAIDFFPYSTQYIFLTAEDAIRVIAIKNQFDGDPPSFCEKTNRTDCFIKLLDNTQRIAPFNSTGMILMLSVGADIITKEKKENPNNKFHYLIKLLELANKTTRYIETSSRVANVMPYFPTKEINKLDQNEKEKVERWISSNKEVNLTDEKHKEALYEAYAMQVTDDQLIEKFQKNVGQKIKKIKESGLESLDNKNKTKDLTQEQITQYKLQIKSN